LNLFKKRLLHFGASSRDIICAYIATIGALKVLDESGISLEIIGDSMRTYLRGRDDAIRCVVAHLMEEENGSLLQEFRSRLRCPNADTEFESNNASATDGNESEESMDSDLAMEDAEQWQPDPLDSVFIKTPIFKQNSRDTIGLLVKIFGSRELFVDEYKKLLADRLLARQSAFYQIDKETEYLELMKLRFGEHSMRDCAVMIADIANSERIRNNVLQITNEQAFDCTILSSQYWPQNKVENELKTNEYLPPRMAQIYERFESVYSDIKKPRKVDFLAQHGSVDLEIELNETLITVTTKPMNASLLILMIDLKQITIAELEKKFATNESERMHAIMYWQKRGIVKRMFDKKSGALIGYRLADGKDEEVYALNCLKKEKNQKHKIGGDVCEQYEDSNVCGLDASEKEKLFADFERTVLGVLTVFQGSPIERIMTRVKQMELHPIYAKISMSELQSVMDDLTTQKRVICTDGMYKRCKK